MLSALKDRRRRSLFLRQPSSRAGSSSSRIVMTDADLIQDLRAHLSDELLPELAANGSLGRDVSIVEQNIERVGGHGVDHWMSHSFHTALKVLCPGASSPRTLALVTKYQIQDSAWCNTALTFRNEEVMYTKVVPFFESLWAASSDKDEALGIFPKCYAVRAGARRVVVMEDLSEQGFRLASSPSALDSAHVLVALRRLGRLHALSYCAKIRRRDDFLSLAAELVETQFVEAHRAYEAGFLTTVAGRGLAPLAASGDVDSATIEHLRRRLAGTREASPVFDVMVNARTAEEPLAVIVHGDFCRNNILFKYDDRGQPVDIRFIDFQTVRYCSPTVDLSFFLFLNTTPAVRAAHWVDFFQAYYDGLTATMRSVLAADRDPDAAPTSTWGIPSLASIQADFAKHALYSYNICSYFLPVMQFGTSPTEEDFARVREEYPDRYEAGCMVGKLQLEVGGAAGDETCANLLREFINRGLVGL